MGAAIIHIAHPLVPELGARKFACEPGLTASQALFQSGWVFDQPTFLLRRDIAANPVKYSDIFVEREDWSRELLDNGGHAVFVTLPHVGDPGTGASAIAIVLSKLAATAATALATAFPATMGSTLLGVSLTKIATAVFFIGGQMLVSSLLPAPKSFTLPSTDSPTYSLSAQSNRARLGAPIPDPIGRNMMVLDLISAPWTRFVDNKQQVMQLFGAGRGRQAIEQIRAGEAVLWEDGAVSSSYPEIEIEICEPGDTHTIFEDDVVTSTEVNSQTLLGTNEEGYATLGPYTVCKPGKRALALEFDIVMAACFQTTSDGHLDPTDVGIKFWGQKIDDQGNGVGGDITFVEQTLSMSTRNPIRRTIRVELSEAGRYRVWGKRTNVRATENNAQDQIQWYALRAFLPSKMTYANETTIAIRATGTANLNGDTLQKINTIGTRMLPLYNRVTKTWTAETATRSIAAGVCYLLKSIGGKTDAQIDLDLLWSLNETWASRGDWWDFVFDQRQSLWQDGLEPMLLAGRTKPLLLGDKVTFYRDEPQTIPTTTFSPRNMVAGQFDVDFVHDDGQSPDALVAVYIDNRTWTEQRVLCALPVSTATLDTASEINIKGITDRAHVWRDTMFTLADTNYRRRNTTFPTAREGTACLPGSLIPVSHWQSRWGNSADVIDLVHGDTVVIGGVTIYRDMLTLSEPWLRPDGVDGTPVITINAPDGRTYGPIPFDVLDDGNESGLATIRLTDATQLIGKYAGKQPREWGLWDGAGLQKERPRCTIGIGTLTPRNCKLVTMKPDTGNKSAMLSLVVDDPRVYTVDTGTPPPEVIPDTAGLVITKINIIERTVLAEAHRYAGDFTVEGAGDAASFEAQYRLKIITLGSGGVSYTFQPWDDLIVGLTRAFTFDRFTTTLTVPPLVELRVRAKSAVGKYGPWHTLQFFADGLDDTPPANVGEVKASRAWDKFATAAITYTWPAIADATSYLIQFKARRKGSDSWSVWGSREVQANSFTYYAAAQVDDGGPFNNCYAQVKAKNSIGTSPDWVGAESNYP